MYTLTPGSTESTIHVFTVRLNGKQIYTVDLIVCRDSSAFWGKPQKQFVGVVEEARATWRCDGTTFYWRKLQ